MSFVARDQSSARSPQVKLSSSGLNAFWMMESPDSLPIIPTNEAELVYTPSGQKWLSIEGNYLIWWKDDDGDKLTEFHGIFKFDGDIIFSGELSDAAHFITITQEQTKTQKDHDKAHFTSIDSEMDGNSSMSESVLDSPNRTLYYIKILARGRRESSEVLYFKTNTLLEHWRKSVGSLPVFFNDFKSRYQLVQKYPREGRSQMLLVENQSNQRKFLARMVTCSTQEELSNAQTAILNEYSALKSLEGKECCPVGVEMHLVESTFYLVSDKINGEPLELWASRIALEGAFSQDLLIRVMLGVTRALALLASQGYAHRNIHKNCILVEKSDTDEENSYHFYLTGLNSCRDLGSPHLLDHGTRRKLHSEGKIDRFTPQEKKRLYADDVHACGQVFYELVYGIDFNPVMRSRIMSDFDASNIAVRPPETSAIGDLRKRQPLFPISNQVQELIFRMTEADYLSRPSAETVYYHIMGIYKLSSAPMLSERSESFQSFPVQGIGFKNKFKYPKSSELIRDKTSAIKLPQHKSAILHSQIASKVNNLPILNRIKTGEADSAILNEFDTMIPESAITQGNNSPGQKTQVVFKSMSLLNSGINAQSGATMISPKGSLSLKKSMPNQSELIPQFTRRSNMSSIRILPVVDA